MDSLLLTLLEIHARETADGRPPQLVIDAYFPGLALTGEVCTPEEYFEQQPQPLQRFVKTLAELDLALAVKNPGMQSDTLNNPRWIHLRAVAILHQDNAQPWVQRVVNGWFRGDLDALLGWSLRFSCGCASAFAVD